MGILDAIVNNWGQWSDDPRKNQANDAYINALAAGLLSGRSNNFGVNLGRAMGGAQGALGEERDRIAKQGLIDAQVGHLGNQGKLIDAQVGHYKTQDDQLRNNLALAQRRASILAQAGGAPGPETMPAPQGGMDVGVFPSAPRSQPGFSQQQIAEYLAAGGKLEDIKGLMESRDWGRRKVARTHNTIDPATGRWVTVQADDYGDQVGSPLPAQVPLDLKDRGGELFGFRADTGVVPGYTVPKTMTPGEAASNGIARANLGLRREELADQQAQRDWDRNNPTFTTIQTDNGIVAVPGRAPIGQAPPVTPLRDAAGDVIRPKATEKVPTEFEAKAGLYFTSMKNASRVLEEIETKGASGVGTAERALSMLPGDVGRDAANWAAGEDRQKYTQAQRQWIDSINRIRSGAAMPEIEYDRAVRTFFPTYKEDEKQREQKRQMRYGEESAVKNAALRVHNIPPLRDPPSDGFNLKALPDAHTVPKGTRGEGRDGKKYRSNGLSWELVK